MLHRLPVWSIRSTSNRAASSRRRIRALPSASETARHQGPWQGMRRGEIEKLKPEYRLVPARDGYALARCELAVFKPEV